MDADNILRELFNTCKQSNSFEDARDLIAVLAKKFAAAPQAASTAAHGSAEALRKQLAERTVEAREASANPNLRVEVDFSSLDATASNFLDNNALHRLCMALRTVCNDDIAKNAFREQVHAVHYKNTKTAPTVELDGKGTLNVQGNFGVLSDSPSDNAIAFYLLDKLRITYQRMLHRVVKEQLPVREKEILTELGAKVQLVPELATFDTPASLEFLDNVGGLRLLMALRTAAMDPSAKELIGGAIKKVEFVNVKNDNEYTIKFDPTTGTLRLACQFDRLQSEAGSKLLSHYQIYDELSRHLNVAVAQKSKELRERQLPEREKELLEILNVPVKYEVSYSSFVNADELNFVDNVSCHRISMACRCIFGGDKDRVAGRLRRVRLINVPKEDQKRIEFAGDTLEIYSCYGAGLNGAFSDGEIRAALTKQ